MRFDVGDDDDEATIRVQNTQAYTKTCATLPQESLRIKNSNLLADEQQQHPYTSPWRRTAWACFHVSKLTSTSTHLVGASGELELVGSLEVGVTGLTVGAGVVLEVEKLGDHLHG